MRGQAFGDEVPALDAQDQEPATERNAEVILEHRLDIARLREVGRQVLGRIEDALCPDGTEFAGDPDARVIKDLAKAFTDVVGCLHKAIQLERQAYGIGEGESGEGESKTIQLPGLTILVEGENGRDNGHEDPEAA